MPKPLYIPILLTNWTYGRIQPRFDQILFFSSLCSIFGRAEHGEFCEEKTLVFPVKQQLF